MIIWGSKGRKKVVSKGQFYCPRCRTHRPYHNVRVSKHFTLYFIPLFETKHLGSFIECQFCFTPFDISVLGYGQEMQAKFNQVVTAIEDQINEGVPVNIIYSELLETGISEEAANNFLSVATKGKLLVCEKCKLVYSGSLSFCSACGSQLTTPE